jgi:hypothetical protein
MEQRKDTVEDLGRALKETVPDELKERVEQAIQDSIKMTESGKRYVEHVRAGMNSSARTRSQDVIRDPRGKGQRPANGARPRRSLGMKTRRWKPVGWVLKAWRVSYAAGDS